MESPSQENDKRPSFDNIYMMLAQLMSQRSTCKRLQVGTVITSIDGRKVFAVGYNGNASGLPNTCDTDEPGSCGCCHSELNAVVNCDAPRYMNKYVYVTHNPCITCAKTLINLGNVVKVFFQTEYRDLTSIKLLQSVGIEVERMNL